MSTTITDYQKKYTKISPSITSLSLSPLQHVNSKQNHDVHRSEINQPLSIYSVFCREDLENYCKLTILLSQKDLLQTELAKLNDVAEEVDLNPDDRKLYAWITLQIPKLNEDIKIRLTQLKERIKEIIQVHPWLENVYMQNNISNLSISGSQRYQFISNECDYHAKNLVDSLMISNFQSFSIQDYNILDLITNCVSIGYNVIAVAQKKSRSYKIKRCYRCLLKSN